MFRTRRLSAALLVACLLPVAAWAAETERFHKVVPLGPGGTLKLHNFSGAVRITGADVSQVTIDAVRRADRDRLERIKLDVAVSGNTVTIDANKKDDNWGRHHNNVVETEFDIQVPRETVIDLEVFSSAVRVAGVTGRQTLHSFSGRLEVVDAPAHLRAKTFSGPVDLQFAPVASEPEVDVHTFSGAIDVRLADGARAKLAFTTFSGDLTSDLPITLHQQSRRRLVGDIGGGGGNQVALQTFSGDVKVR